MNNVIIRTALFRFRVRAYELARNIMGVSENTLYRRLRDELPEEEQEKIAADIAAYAARRAGN